MKYRIIPTVSQNSTEPSRCRRIILFHPKSCWDCSLDKFNQVFTLQENSGVKVQFREASFKHARLARVASFHYKVWFPSAQRETRSSNTKDPRRSEPRPRDSQSVSHQEEREANLLVVLMSDQAIEASEIKLCFRFDGKIKISPRLSGCLLFRVGRPKWNHTFIWIALHVQFVHTWLELDQLTVKIWLDFKPWWRLRMSCYPQKM